MRRAAWVLAAVMVCGAARPVAAQPGPLAPTGGPPAQTNLPPDSGPTIGLPPDTPSHSASDEPPTPRLGPPVMGLPVQPADREPQNTGNVRVVGVDRGDGTGSSEPAPRLSPGHPGEATPTVRHAVLGAPEAAGNPVSPQAVEAPYRTTYAPPAHDPVNDLLTKRAGNPAGERRTTDRGHTQQSSSAKFGDKIGETFNNILGQPSNPWFKSDHAFDGFISPVTNPFLFEDPRALTEVRPIFMYQKIPTLQADFHGGNAWFFGMQARVAVTDRLSFVINKLGGVSVNPGSGSAYGSDLGVAELWFGPKYTFIRGEQTGTLLAGGLQFQLPIGSGKTFQDTGGLSLVPYLTFAQNFGKDFRVGSFNTMIGTGYSASVNSQRSDYYYLSAHLDWDVWNNHIFYPLVETNWYVYTTNGKSQPIGSEGRDLFNFGANAAGKGLLTGAIGGRIKITESAQIGAAFEVPLAGPRDIFQYRFTLDFILRY